MKGKMPQNREEITEELKQALLAEPEATVVWAEGFKEIPGLFKTWSLGPVIAHRDSDYAQKAKAEAFERYLSFMFPDLDSEWKIVEFSHDVVGWVKHWAFHVTNRVLQAWCAFEHFWAVNSSIRANYLRRLYRSDLRDWIRRDFWSHLRSVSADDDWADRVLAWLDEHEPWATRPMPKATEPICDEQTIKRALFGCDLTIEGSRRSEMGSEGWCEYMTFGDPSTEPFWYVAQIGLYRYLLIQVEVHHEDEGDFIAKLYEADLELLRYLLGRERVDRIREAHKRDLGLEKDSPFTDQDLVCALADHGEAPAVWSVSGPEWKSLVAAAKEAAGEYLTPKGYTRMMHGRDHRAKSDGRRQSTWRTVLDSWEERS